MVRAVDAYNKLSRYRELLEISQDCYESKERTELLLNLYLDQTEEPFDELGENLEQSHLELRLMANSELIARAEKHLPLLQAIPNAVVVTVHDTDESKGFIYLDVLAPIPDRLNTARDILIGKSARLLPDVISAPRQHHIKRALANGQCESYSYEYRDSHLWKFNVTVAPLYGTEEVITIVRDAADWQVHHWLNRLT